MVEEDTCTHAEKKESNASSGMVVVGSGPTTTYLQSVSSFFSSKQSVHNLSKALVATLDKGEKTLNDQQKSAAFMH